MFSWRGAHYLQDLILSMKFVFSLFWHYTFEGVLHYSALNVVNKISDCIAELMTKKKYIFAPCVAAITMVN